MEKTDLYIDVDDGLKRVMNNKSIYIRLLQSFLANNPFTSVEADIAKADVEAALHSVHTLKGVTANLSFVKVNQDCIALESALRAGQPYESLFERLAMNMEATLGEIQGLLATP